MPQPPRPRGRPKGSGINDRPRLRDIAALIASQPQIKPTTAIKMLGEHDPSVIRRLRDKFYTMQGELMAEVRSFAISHPHGAFSVPQDHGGISARALSAVGQTPAAAPDCAMVRPTAKHVDPVAAQVHLPRPPDLAGEVASKERLAELAAYNVMLGFAIQASVAAIGHNWRLCEETLRMPPLAAMLRQQIAIGEMVMSLAWPKSSPAAPMPAATAG
jgi:hypothetical protein